MIGRAGTAIRNVVVPLTPADEGLRARGPRGRGRYLALALVMAQAVAGAGCGAQRPFNQIRDTPEVTATQVRTTLSGKGFRLALEARCQSRVIDVWCPPRSGTSESTCSTPPMIHKEDVDCPSDLSFKGVRISIRSPWGGVYSAMSDADGIVEVPVDWKASGIDPLAPGAAAQLATGWLAYSNDARFLLLKIDQAMVDRMLGEIGAATDTQYEVGAANEKAALSAEIADGPALVLGHQGEITLAITNNGPQPAYRVIAKLRSSVDALHGHQLSFGRIDPGKTKSRTRAVALPPKLEERSAMVVAELSYFNGERIETKKKVSIVPEPKRVEPKRVEAPRALAMDCKLATPEVAPGERVRLDCELRNLSSEPASELGVAVSIRGVVHKNLAPKSLPGAGSATLELIGLTSAGEKQGEAVPVIVRASALGIPPVERPFSVRIASFATKCKARLTRDEYKAKRKRLQAALDSGALTQKEFDNYDAELVACLR